MDEAIVRAVKEYGYSQKEIADYPALHYSTITRIAKTSNVKT
jgi:transposase